VEVFFAAACHHAARNSLTNTDDSHYHDLITGRAAGRASDCPLRGARNPGEPHEESVYGLRQLPESRKHILTEQKNIKFSKKYLVNIFQSPLY